MKKKATLFILAFLTLPILLMGCSSKAPASPTTNPALIYTAAAQTADARLTQIFQSTPSATPVTPTPTFDAVKTIAAQTASALLTQAAMTPRGTATSTPIPTSPPGADRAIFVADVTIPDNTIIAPGAAFVKTWKLQNGGTTTWTTSYSLAFISGEQMGTITSVRLDQSVPPGQQINVSVDLVAPTKTGTSQGYWKMKNASGQFFNDSMYVLIVVGSGGATPTAPTNTPGPSPTATSTGIPSNPINSLTMSVDTPSATECPHTFNFTAWVTLNQRATLTYNLEAGSDTGYEFDLPAPQTGTYDAGTFPLTFELTFTSAGAGWVSFHVTSPVDKTSNQAAFTLTCSP